MIETAPDLLNYLVDNEMNLTDRQKENLGNLDDVLRRMKRQEKTDLMNSINNYEEIQN